MDGIQQRITAMSEGLNYFPQQKVVDAIPVADCESGGSLLAPSMWTSAADTGLFPLHMSIFN